MGGASPPSSPSNEPRSRRRASSRKSRPKPRSRKQGKPQLASADISTQDSATQGPGSSDTSDVTSPEDGGTPLRTGDPAIESDEEDDDEEYDYGEEGRSLTPNFKSSPGASGTASVSPPGNTHCAVNGVAPMVPVSDIKLSQPPAGRQTNFSKNSSSSAQSKTGSSYTNVDTSDPAHPHTYFSVNSPVTHKDTRQWAVKRQESDLSTAPFSSETSDMDTSGNERVTTADSMVDATGSDHAHSAQSPPLPRLSDGKKGAPLGKPHGERKTMGVASRVRQSGSSGEEVSSAGHRNSKKFAAGKGVPSKPPPPASAAVKRPSIKSKSSTNQSQSSQSPSDSPVIPPRKPLPYHQRNAPLLPNKMGKPSPPPLNGSTKPKEPAESKSTPSYENRPPVSSSSRASVAKPAVKPVVSSRPKPPVNPKPPVAKPAVAPTKPAVKPGLGRVGGASVKSETGVNPPAKPPASHRLSRNLAEFGDVKEGGIKKANGTRSTVHGTAASASKVRTTRRSPGVENNVGSIGRTTGQPAKAVRKNSAGGEETKPKEEGQTEIIPLSATLHKPSIPNKPKRVPERRLSKPQISGPLEIAKDKPVNSLPATASGSSARTTSGPVANSGPEAVAKQSGISKSQSSSSCSDGTASGHSQSPVASPVTNRKSYHAGKSDRVASTSNTVQKSVPNASSIQRSGYGSKSGSSTVSSHKSNSSTTSSQRPSSNAVSMVKSGQNLSGSSKISTTTLQKNSTTSSKSSLSGSGELKKNDTSQASDKSKDMRSKNEQRPRIAALVERRNERKGKVERKKSTGSLGKTKEAAKAKPIVQGASKNQPAPADSIGTVASSCSLDMDSATQSVSEMSLTESPSPSPSPFPSASDLSADQGKHQDTLRHKDPSRDCSSSEDDTPPPIPPREYLKSPEDLLALNLQSAAALSTQPVYTAEPAKATESRPAAAISSPKLISMAPSQNRPKPGPRRPPPNPPKVPPATNAAPTCNIPTSTSERPSGSFAESPASKLVDLTATRERSRQNAGSHYEVVDELARSPVGNERYFEKHRQRDSVDPVNYTLVRGQGDSTTAGDITEVAGKRISQAPQSPPPQPAQRPVLKRATTVGGSNASSIHIRMETEGEETKMGGKINFKDRKMSIGRRPPPLPPKSYAPTSSSSSSSTSIALSTADQEDSSDIYSVIDEEDKAVLLSRTISQPVMAVKQPLSQPLNQPLNQQRVSMILGVNPEEEPPPLPSRPAPPKLKSPISPEACPRNPTNKYPAPPPANPASPVPHRGLILAIDGPPVLEQPPKRRDPVYDVIPEPVKAVRNVNRRRDYEEIVLPELDGEAPKLWVPPEREKEKIKEQEEVKQAEEQKKQRQDDRQKQQEQLQKQQRDQPPKQQRDLDQQGDDWSSSSGKSSPFLSKRNSISSNGSGGGVGGASAPLISVILPDKAGSRLATNLSKKSLDIGDLRENWREEDIPVGVASPPIMRRKQAMSFSGRQNLKVKGRTASCRRSHSERLNKFKVNATIGPTSSEIASFRRSCSLDHLDGRMDLSMRDSRKRNGSSSEEEEGPAGNTNKTATTASEGLPKVPSTDSPYRVPRSHSKPAGPYLMPPDVEPLYQYINTAEFLREGEESVAKPSVSIYEEQSQLSLARQLSMRRLWCEQPDVINSGILKVLTDEERKLQEAMFEVISSEATYLRSLDVLIQHFMDDPGMNPYLPEGRRVIDKRQHHVIFSNVKEVREVSSQFLLKLQSRQRESAVVKNISDIILDFAENKFDCYIRYCTNQVYQIREMQDIIEGNVMFREYLRRLETDKICQNLSMQSFLLLPMQRITRLPLLILAILNRTPLDHPDHDVVENTLRSVQTLVTACNDGARQMDRTEQLHEIHKKLDFGKLKPFPIVSASRQLERRGLLVRLQVEQKLLGKNKIKKKPYYLFVFTDYIIISKKKKDARGEEYFRVKDYASRAVVEVEWLNAYTGVSFPKVGEQDPIAKATAAVSAVSAKHGILLLFLENASGRKEDYILLAQNDTDRTRWIESMMRADDRSNDQEKIYERWDCPQVQAVYDYRAQQPDELDLQRGDVVKVYRKMADGWYEGERLRDLQCGWFPSNFTEEIENAHTKARNLRQTHKLNSSTANARLMVGLKS